MTDDQLVRSGVTVAAPIRAAPPAPPPGRAPAAAARATGRRRCSIWRSNRPSDRSRPGAMWADAAARQLRPIGRVRRATGGRSRPARPGTDSRLGCMEHELQNMQRNEKRDNRRRHPGGTGVHLGLSGCLVVSGKNPGTVQTEQPSLLRHAHMSRPHRDYHSTQRLTHSQSRQHSFRSRSVRSVPLAPNTTQAHAGLAP